MLVFYSFLHWLWKSRNSSYTNHTPHAEALCASAVRNAVLSLSVLMQLLSLNSIWLCSSYLNSIWLFVLTRFVNFRSPDIKSSLFSWWWKSFTVENPLGVWVEWVHCHHFSARQHPPSFCLLIDDIHRAGHLAGDGQQTNNGHNVHYVGHLWPRILPQREGATSNKLQGTHSLSSFEAPLLIRPLILSSSLCLLHKWVLSWAGWEFVSQRRCNKCVFEKSRRHFNLRHTLTYTWRHWVMMSDRCEGCLSPGGSEEDLMVELQLEMGVKPKWDTDDNDLQESNMTVQSLTLWTANVTRYYFSDIYPFLYSLHIHWEYTEGMTQHDTTQHDRAAT